MADSTFFTNKSPFSLKELSNISDASLNDEGFAALEIFDVAPLDKATKNQISFLDNIKYIAKFKQSRAGACIVRAKYAKDAPSGMALLISENPYHAYALISAHFYKAQKPNQPQISNRATISPSAIIGNNCYIESGVVIGDNVRIGDECEIGANSVISAGVEVGNNCTISSSVNISYAKIGNEVIIHSGVCIGQDGFGFAFGGGAFTKVPQLGRVIIKDNVEIGANSCVDRGSSPDTIIGEGTKIDNLVQIAHNVKIGEHCVIAGASGIAGSSELGDYVIIGGHVSISGHLKIGTGAKIGGRSGVTKNIDAGAEVTGMPAVPVKQYLREILTLQKLAKNKDK